METEGNFQERVLLMKHNFKRNQIYSVSFFFLLSVSSLLAQVVYSSESESLKFCQPPLWWCILLAKASVVKDQIECSFKSLDLANLRSLEKELADAINLNHPSLSVLMPIGIGVVHSVNLMEEEKTKILEFVKPIVYEEVFSFFAESGLYLRGVFLIEFNKTDRSSKIEIKIKADLPGTKRLWNRLHRHISSKLEGQTIEKENFNILIKCVFYAE